MFKNSEAIGKILLNSGKIDEVKLTQAAEEQSRMQLRLPLGEVLIKLGYITSEDIAIALAKQLGIPYHELGEGFKFGSEEVRLIPETVARKFHLAPLERKKNAITIVMKDPLNLEAIDTVRSLTNLEVHRAVSTEEKILAAINQCYREEAHIDRSLKDIVDLEMEKLDEDDIAESSVDVDQLRVLANDVPVVRFVNLLLLKAVRDRASDIHFEPAESEVTVRLRVDGLLREVTPPPKALYQAVVTRIKILSNMDIAEKRLPQDGRFKFKVYSRIIDVRVSSLPEANGEKLVLRILDHQSLIVNMEDLGFETDTLDRFQKILKRPHGIILLTGPTGSGKTTTLYSALNFLKSPEKNIQTVEDPIEYLIKGVNQMQIKPQIDLSFASALRSILRQDPDIIMIGEIRDLDTARIAMRAALTGHLVLSTLHTNDATSAFNRLIDIGVEPYLIASTINLVIAQRLVRVVCKRCKREITEPLSSMKMVKSVYPEAGKWKFCMGEGCPECRYTGYKGRTGIFEFLEMNEAIKDIILDGRGEGLLRKRAIELGMRTMLADGFLKVKKGQTSIEEVLAVCPPPDINC
ncbi:MAG: Flp pilus assembly complex ATPase component TadA [Candidatus Omnitrophica bacterium]|nr:Flp pilus assembly complex ATPase component TadA [Candidatus Omnitrophota bacterium]